MTEQNGIPKKRWFSSDEVIGLIPQSQYTDTAYGWENLPQMQRSSLIPQKPAPIRAEELGKRHQVKYGQEIPDDIACHEYLALDLTSSKLKRLREQEKEKAVYRNVLKNYQLDSKHGFYPGAYSIPSVALIPSFWWVIYVRGVVSVLVTLTPLFLPGMIIMSFFIDGFLPVLKGLFFLGTEPHWLVWGYLLLIPLLKLLKYFEKRGWHQLLDPKEIPLLCVIQRNTGMVRIFNNKKEWADLPFDEFEGLNTLVPAGRALQIRKLAFRHKKTGAGFIIGDGTTDGWYTGLNWEYYRHYMDVSRPLPDIPFWEPYRHLDPTTKAWDEEHNRPERLWRDMDDETYEKMVEASIAAAKKYPYLKPEKAKEEGWQSAGDGKHWYQLG
jgi:hypothetical protein